MRKEFRYVAFVAIVGISFPVRFESGWWSDKSKAKAEVEGIMSYNLPAGPYQVSMNLQERDAQ